MFQDVMIDEPIEKIIDDWDFFNDEVVTKFSMFPPVGKNIYGVRRRAVSEAGIIDTYKGNVSGAIELGPHGFFKGSETAVRTDNSDRRYRTCPECGHLNPMGYCWNPAKDTPQERAARAMW